MNYNIPHCTIYSFLISNSFIHSFIHSVVCLMTGQLPLPKQVVQGVRSSTSSFKYQLLLLPLKLLSGRLRLLPSLRFPYIYPFIFHSLKCFRKQFLHTMLPSSYTPFYFR